MVRKSRASGTAICKRRTAGGGMENGERRVGNTRLRQSILRSGFLDSLFDVDIPQSKIRIPNCETERFVQTAGAVALGIERDVAVPDLLQLADDRGVDVGLERAGH